MATAAAASASEAEAEPKAGPEAEGEEDEAKAARARRKVLSRAVAAATYKTMGPEWDQQEEGVSESDGDEEYAMASSAESSPGEYEWGYDEEEKNQLEIERLEEQVGTGVGYGGGLRRRPLSLGFPGPGPPPWSTEVIKSAKASKPQLPTASQVLGALTARQRITLKRYPLGPSPDPGEGIAVFPVLWEDPEAPGGGNSLAHHYTSCKLASQALNFESTPQLPRLAIPFNLFQA